MFNGTTKPLPISEIEGIQTIIPSKETHPRSSRRISVIDPLDPDIYKQRCHIILYYKPTCSEDSGWVFAGFTKESFGMAMEQQPIIGGRVRRGKDGEESGGDMALEIVSNDCGVRLVEARIPVALSEFLDRKDREDAEAELVFWKDFDEKNPQFCPPLYVQVTNFQCGGYSVGISCSLLLADPSAIINFLFIWAKTHGKLVSENDFKILPLYYLPNLRPRNTKNLIVSDQIKNRNKSVIFTTPGSSQNRNADKELVSTCIEEAETELGVKMPKETRLFSVTSFKEIMVEKYLRASVVPQFPNKLARVGWDHLGANEISFYEGNKPISVSNWVYSAPGEVLAILTPSSGNRNSSMNIVVSIPN